MVRQGRRRLWPVAIVLGLGLAAAPWHPSAAQSAPAAASSSAADLLAEGRKAIAAKDYARAVELLTKAAGLGSAEAQELLGLARERTGQLAQARLAYSNYLKSHPSGEGAERVRTRLSGVLAAMESEATEDLAARRKVKLQAKPSVPVRTTPGALQSTALGKTGRAPDAAAKDGWQWQAYGSAGQFYYRNDGFTGANLRRGTFGSHEAAQNDIVSSADVTLRGENGPNEIKIRIAGYEQTDLQHSGLAGDTTISSAYVDMRNRLNGLSARAGRQTRYGGGVFGRFDGLLLGSQLDEQVLAQVVMGSPVYYSDIEPFADDRVFFGASVDLTTQDKVWSGTLYAIGQNTGDAIDRRAVGAELRYAKGGLTGYANADFDVHYGEFNSATISANWEVVDGLLLFASADYRHVPFLLTSNALAGQSATSLASLIDILGVNETEALAVDRTASARMLTGGFTTDLSPKWQFTLDASLVDYSGTPASGGVDAIPDPGIEVYVSALIGGSGIFRDEDYAGIGINLIGSSDYRTIMADLAYRFDVQDDWRLSPRLRLAYRDGQQGLGDQILIMPSLGLRYRVSDHWSLESEIALRWEDNFEGAGDNQNAEVLMTAGYRYQF